MGYKDIGAFEDGGLDIGAFTGPGGAGGGGIAWNAYGHSFLYTAANWSSPNIYLETFMRATTGTMYARLYDVTASAAVASSQIETISATLTRVRSSALTLTTAHIYRVQFGVDIGDGGKFVGARIIFV